MHSTEQTIQHRDVRRILAEIERDGLTETLKRLDEVEPVLNGYAFAIIHVFVEQLLREGLEPHLLEMVRQEMVTLQCLCVESVRSGNRRLWADFMPSDTNDGSSASLDKSSDDGGPPKP